MLRGFVGFDSSTEVSLIGEFKVQSSRFNVSAHSVDKSGQVHWTDICAPSHMAVWADENQLALVQCGNVTVLDINNLERDVASCGSSDERRCIDVSTEAQ